MKNDYLSISTYIMTSGGLLPSFYVKKSEVTAYNIPLADFLRHNAVGGDIFHNYEGRLPAASYRECDIDTANRPNRGRKRLVYTSDGSKVYLTTDHYFSFKEL